MTQKELSEKIGLTDQHRIVQYEKGVRVPKKDLVDKMALALDVNPYTLYDTAGRDASEMMELLFWLDEFNPSALHLFLPRKFPGEKCNEVADTSVYYHDNDSWPAHAPICMWFDYGVLNDFLKEWVVRMDELKSGEITRDEYLNGKSTGHRLAMVVENMNLRNNGVCLFFNTTRLIIFIFYTDYEPLFYTYFLVVL